MARTKKVGISGRFGSRYGKGVKDRIKDIERIQRKKHTCPECLKPALKREASGIWKCKKCGAKFAGKAYEPSLT
ncbi:MAG: 50S ribosomal protein L37ae [Candidatus Aenigmarchaeota archaeon]|nr:50S ribosomal protein L37ae [Candidatus Aenigmarchaeota archaeon]